ncbi:MAG: hypothetical protein ACLSA2_10795 [Candidatus Gastranaerophilaceae bacterium]|nr:pilin putative [Clostridium sp. CAG:967]
MKHHNITKKLFAFTLAEVLITLGIIGIVAAMTMPALIANYQERVIVSQLKKVYSTLSQAVKMAEAEYGDISEWPVKDGDMNSTDTIYNHYIKPYLNITKECKNSEECFSSYNLQPLHYYTFCLNDGSMVSLDLNNKNEDPDSLYPSYGIKNVTLRNFIDFTVDVNGDKKPNKPGEDIFRFFVTQKGLIPLGADQDAGTTKNRCKRPQTGFYCTAYMLTKY